MKKHLKELHFTPLMAAAPVIIAQGLILGVAFTASPESPLGKLWIIPAAALLAGALSALFFSQKMWALFVVYITGLVIADISALQMAYFNVERTYAVAVSTVGFFSVVSLAVGFLIELVGFLHQLIHRTRRRSGRGPKPTAGNQSG